MNKIISAMLACILLSGCGLSPEYRAKQEQRLIENAKNTCTKYGFRDGTDGMSNCIAMQVQKQIDDQERMMQAIGGALKSYGDSAAASSQRRMNCTYTQHYNTVYQDCY